MYCGVVVCIPSLHSVRRLRIQIPLCVYDPEQTINSTMTQVLIMTILQEFVPFSIFSNTKSWLVAALLKPK